MSVCQALHRKCRLAKHRLLRSVHYIYPRGDVLYDPVHSSQQILSSHCRARLYMPVMRSDRVEIEPLSNLVLCHGSVKVLLVCKDEQGSASKLFFFQ